MGEFNFTIKRKACQFMIGHNEQAIKMIDQFQTMPEEDRDMLKAYHQEQIDHYNSLLMLINPQEIIDKP